MADYEVIFGYPSGTEDVVIVQARSRYAAKREAAFIVSGWYGKRDSRWTYFHDAIVEVHKLDR